MRMVEKVFNKEVKKYSINYGYTDLIVESIKVFLLYDTINFFYKGIYLGGMG